MRNDQNFVIFVSFVVVTGAICGRIAIFLHIFGGDKGQYWIDDTDSVMVTKIVGSGAIQEHDCVMLPVYHGTGTTGYAWKCPLE